MSRESVSVITCCRNEANFIAGYLCSLDAQERADFDLEVVIADGLSSDGTRPILDEFTRSRPWVRVVDNPDRVASTGLNIAIGLSRGSVVIRMDAHTEYAPDYLRRCLDVLRRERAHMVGGPMRMGRGTYWQNAIGAAYGSRFFSGGSRVYDVEYEGPVDSALYGCWPRGVLEAVGSFDERMVRNQDDELALRIVKGGGRIWQSREIRSWYYPRRSLQALARQFFGYGFWKVYTMRKHRTVVRWRHAMPAIALGMLAIRKLRCWLLRAYVAAVLGASLRLVRGGAALRLFPALLAIFPAAHVAYGVGTLAGLLRFGTR